MEKYESAEDKFDIYNNQEDYYHLELEDIDTAGKALIGVEEVIQAMHVHLGRCYRVVRDFKKAEEHIQKDLTIHPFWPDAN